MNIQLANTSLYVLPMFRWFCGDLKKGRAVFKGEVHPEIILVSIKRDK